MVHQNPPKPHQSPLSDASRSARFQILTPSKVFSGRRGGLQFTDGAAFTNDATAAQDCRDCGYEVIELPRSKPASRGASD